MSTLELLGWLIVITPFAAVFGFLFGWLLGGRW